MIIESEKEIIVQFLGKHPSRVIIPVLNEKGVLNKNGLPYSPKIIQNILNGITENITVEKEILDIVETKKNLKNHKKQVLSK
ncbi:MAG: hypothetical protein CMP76_07945 [Flavobacterium sp.]|uniref:hypothetical protein n=1 Tax=Flavobacterium sp. TaxID=239 RepID=UPI000C4A2902|nr:hypothetical protein [Flavobacterium sp.]MBF03212.1 hypothetical protein [Flavobacterium sp.]|tara:strand:- start:730 stop:975 length:246 start_codon:yes stop_codon:yes gene_type:complete